MNLDIRKGEKLRKAELILKITLKIQKRVDSGSPYNNQMELKRT